MHLCAYTLLELTDSSSHIPRMKHSVYFIPDRYHSASMSKKINWRVVQLV